MFGHLLMQAELWLSAEKLAQLTGGNKSKVKKACGGEVTFVNARGFNNMLPGKRKQTKLG